ncbi:hypothetical protein GOA91_15130 [Sinorhizobium meliloti]|nr:hypothetical protein [Sinorhizobium meliloti]
MLRVRLFSIVTLVVCLSSPSNAWQETATYFYSTNKPVALRNDPAVTPPEEFIVPYPDDSVVLLGEGYDLITGYRRPTYCITAGPAERVNFYDKNIHFSQITDEESLLTKLNTSLSASAKYAGYSGGGSYKSSVETKTSTKDISVVAQADLKSFAITMKVPEARLDGDYPPRRFDLSPEALTLLESDKVAFRKFCGDGYVAQITYGADFYAKFKYSELSYEKRTTVETSLNASGPGGVFDVKASESQQNEFKSKKVRETIEAFERGGAPAALPTNREQVIDTYRSLAERAKDNERPLFLVIRRYSALPSGKGKEFETISDQLDGMVRRVLRLQSLLYDYDDAIYQLSKGPDRGFLVNLYPIEEHIRTRAGFIERREALKNDLISARKKIRDCLTFQSKQTCLLGRNNSLFGISAILPRATISDDLRYRAISPLARNHFSPDEIQSIKDFVDAGGTLRAIAACMVIETIQREHIEEVTARRCESGECLPDTDIQAYKDHVFDGFTVKSCPLPNRAPFPANPAPQKGLGFVQVPLGYSIKMTGIKDPGAGDNKFKASLACASGETFYLGEWSNITKTYLDVNMNCTLQVIGTHSGARSTIYRITPGAVPIAGGNRYTFEYDDDIGGIDYDDMVVVVDITSKN